MYKQEKLFSERHKHNINKIQSAIDELRLDYIFYCSNPISVMVISNTVFSVIFTIKNFDLFFIILCKKLSSDICLTIQRSFSSRNARGYFQVSLPSWTRHLASTWIEHQFRDATRTTRSKSAIKLKSGSKALESFNT